MLLPLYAVTRSASTYLHASCWNNPSQHRPATYLLTKCSDSRLSVELLMSSYEEDLRISIWWVWLLSLRLNQMHLRLPCLNHLVPSGPSGYISWTIRCPLSLGDNLLLLPKDEPYNSQSDKDTASPCKLCHSYLSGTTSLRKYFVFSYF